MNSKFKPVPGCGPYLMTYEMMQPQKEEKMSTLAGYELLKLPPDKVSSDEAKRLHDIFVQGMLSSPHNAFAQQQSALVAKRDALAQQQQNTQFMFTGASTEAQTRAAVTAQRLAQSSSDTERCALSRAYNAENRVRELEEANRRMTDTNIWLMKKLAAAEAPGDHPYHGPVKDGKSVPDETHERFHKSIGDVIAGKVMQDARRQMQEALKNVPKEKAPFPTGADKSDPRRIGWRGVQ